MENLRGSCHCGAVTLRIPASAAGVIACHCEDCQKLHGNFFALFALPEAELELGGAEHVRWYASSPKARRAFCDVCGSRIAKQANGSDRVMVSAGLFGAVTGARIRRNLYAASKPDWYDVPTEEGA